LLGEGAEDRKVWIDNRLRELAEIFSIAVGGFSIMDNHRIGGHPRSRIATGDLCYIDLKPVAAGIAKFPEASKHTSVKERVDHVKDLGRTEDLEAARKGSAAGSKPSAGLEESHWLCPIEDRPHLDSWREGMIEGYSLGNYVMLVDYTARLFREGKATISREVAEIFERIGTTAEIWQARLVKLGEGRILGRFLAASRQRLREVAGRLGLRRAVNLANCLVT
jgi:hypothetical protein